jgi:hypothetical protein
MPRHLSLTAALSDEPSRLDCLTALALSRAVNAKADAVAREGVTEGHYDIDMTVRLVGTIEVLADTDKKPTVSIPMKEVLALFVARSGCTREASVKLLRECMTEALLHGVKGEGAVAAAADIAAEHKKVVNEMLEGLPRTFVAGAVKADIEARLVSGSCLATTPDEEATAA